MSIALEPEARKSGLFAAGTPWEWSNAEAIVGT